MSDFITKLKDQYAVKVDPERSGYQVREDFKSEVTLFIKGYLEALNEALDKINSRATDFFRNHEHQSVGAQDNFSKNFEKEISYLIVKWIATDETLRVTFKKIMAAYGKRLKSTDMLEILDKELGELEKDLAEHVAKANTYGKAWGERMNTLGLVALKDETRNTIKWFTNLTVAELRRSFESN